MADTKMSSETRDQDVAYSSAIDEKPRTERHSLEHNPDLAVEEIEKLEKTELDIIELSPEHQRKVIRKLDFILVPQLAILYLLAFLDRGNSKFRFKLLEARTDST